MPELRKVHLIGAGGVGVAALGEILLDSGIEITGSDLIGNQRTAQLALRGACIRTGHAAENLPSDANMVIFSSAAAADNPELVKAHREKIPCVRRGEFLGLWARRYPVVAAVSGSHGKTSVTAMLCHIARKCGAAPGCLIGGIVPGERVGCAGNGELFIAEVDESDGSHTAIHPTLGIIVNADDDHAWSLGGAANLRLNFQKFANNSATLLGDPGKMPECVWHDHRDFHRITLPGKNFRDDDAALAFAAARLLGFSPAPDALADFPGVERRMTVRRNDAAALVIEDYAHAPAELRSSLAFLRNEHGDRHLRVLFQPHRYARLARYFDEFVPLLATADSCFIAPVFAAWSETGSPNAADLARAVGAVEAKALDSVLAAALLEPPADGKKLLIAVIGAGDVNQILPLLESAR